MALKTSKANFKPQSFYYFKAFSYNLPLPYPFIIAIILDDQV